MGGVRRLQMNDFEGQSTEMNRDAKIAQLRDSIFSQVREYYALVHDHSSEEFIPGTSRVNYAGRVFDAQEMLNLTDAMLEFWLTAGRWTREFEAKLAAFLGVKSAFFVNSGSSANLLAFMTLTSDLLGERAIRRGDEVITVAAGFPTTVAPILQFGAIPVFVDVTLPSYNIDVTQLEAALSPRTRAVMVAHTLGNPFDIHSVKSFCEKHGLWLVEDNCDALGSTYAERFTGTFGDIGTSSFYPPHHLTTGEGGAVYTNSPLLRRIFLSFRDWGRDCWCDSGRDNTCGCRFTGQFGELPLGYDHKYVYRHFGYNLKATDLQAAVGCAQLEKFPAFAASRRENWRILRQNLSDLEDFFILPEPEPNSSPCWFGFALTLRDGLPFTRTQFVQHLESCKIQTRALFAGNLTKHPCFDALRAEGSGYRTVGMLPTTDRIMNSTFWIGVYPGMTPAMLAWMESRIREFVAKHGKK